MMEISSNTQLVALTPAELVPAQAHLMTWCQQKIVALGSELREQRQNHRQAHLMKWKKSGWGNAITKTKRRMIYYAKIRAALKAGYLVIPNFVTDVIAVRVSEGAQPRQIVGVEVARPELLPHGVGQYVDDSVIGHQVERRYEGSDGKPRTTTDFIPDRYDTTPDFPGTLVKPIVLAAAQRAMALRIFDQIGVVTGTRRGDPIVVGEIFDPAERSFRWPGAKRVSFFVAWYLDVKTI